MSTTLLIGRWPAAMRRAFSQRGDGPILTSSNSRAVKRGQNSGSSTSIVTPSIGPGVPGSVSHGGGVLLALEHAPHDEVVEPGDAVRVHAVDLGPGHRQAAGQLGGLHAGVDV